MAALEILRERCGAWTGWSNDYIRLFRNKEDISLFSHFTKPAAGTGPRPPMGGQPLEALERRANQEFELLRAWRDRRLLRLQVGAIFVDGRAQRSLNSNIFDRRWNLLAPAAFVGVFLQKGLACGGACLIDGRNGSSSGWRGGVAVHSLGTAAPGPARAPARAPAHNFEIASPALCLAQRRAPRKKGQSIGSR